MDVKFGSYADSIRALHKLKQPPMLVAPHVEEKPKQLLTRPPVKLPVVQGEAPKLSLVSIIDRYLHSIQKEERVDVTVSLGHPRSQGRYHPSSICKEGVCERALAYELLHAPAHADINARLHRIFGMGHFVHARLQHTIGCAIKQMNGQFWDEIRLPPYKNISGTTDGGIVLGGWPYLLEIKSMNKKNYLELGSKPWDEHYDQVNIYMKLAQVNAAIILIECKDNSDLREFFVRFSPERFARIESTVNSVDDYILAKQLPPQITNENGCQGKQCGFYGVCKGDQKTVWQPDFERKSS